MKKALAILLILATCISCRKEYFYGDGLTFGDRIPECLSEYGSGEALIVLFSTLCGDCREELPVVDTIALECPDVKCLAIGRDQTTGQIDEYWRKEGLSIPYREDPDRKIYSMFATSTVPRCYYCRDGIICNIWKDRPIMSGEKFREARKR